MQDFVEGVVGRFEVKNELPDLVIGELVRGGHVVEGLEPFWDFLLATVIAGQYAQAVHGVDEVAKIRVKLVHGLDLQSQFVHQRYKQRNDVCDAFRRVAFVVFDRYWTVLFYSLQGRWTVQAEGTGEGVDGGKLVALYLQVLLIYEFIYIYIEKKLR